MKKVCLIVNPISGSGRGLRAAREAAAEFGTLGIAATIRPTGAPGDATRFAAESATDHDAVFAVGGDGTLNEVVTGLPAGFPAGIIPVGTANVVARDLGVYARPAEAARRAARGVPRPFDVGTVNDRCFLAMVGIGFDGAIVQAICEKRRGPISMATYVAPALSTLWNFRSPTLHVEIDGIREPIPHHGAIITNTRNYGGLFSVTPAAKPDDGLLHWIGYKSPSKAALLAYSTFAAWRREAPKALATYGSGTSFVVTSDTPCAVEADGDYIGTTPIRIGIRPNGCTLLAPPVKRA